MPDEPTATPSPLAIAAASFLVQALELGDAPEAIAPELVPIEEAPHAAIHSVELESSIGTAAFLVYTYVLGETDADGASGAEQFQRGLETLQRAAERDTPGPRMVAHADNDAVGFILATTPATWRRLRGDQPEPSVATEADLPVTAVSLEDRAAIAEDLHRSLREASEHAGRWLGAIRAAARHAGDDKIDFSEAETALALFVLDAANVQPTLNALNLLVTAAQESSGTMLDTTAATEGA